MNMLRSLILLLLVSALGSANPAYSVTAVDGYLDQADGQQSLMRVQEHEGDDPEGLASKQPCASPVIAVSEFAGVQGPACVANYSDFHPRAPPHYL